MRIKNNRIEGIHFRAAHYTGGAIKPTLVILHDTAGRLEKGNSAAYLASANSAKVSAHFIIEWDGTIEQQVPTNRRANHAGISNYHGRSGCNGFSIGIEFVNPGRMIAVSPDAYGRRGRSWWGEVFSAGDYALAEVETVNHGHGVWMAPSAEQIEAATTLLEVLFKGIPTLTDIRPHWYVSPGRKVDTNPLFPLDALRAHILGTSDPADIAAEEQSDAVPTAQMLMVVTTGSGLNMRRWPSFNPNVITSVPNGTVLPVIRSGMFDGRRWNLVLFDGREGWVVDAYTTPV